MGSQKTFQHLLIVTTVGGFLFVSQFLFAGFVYADAVVGNYAPAMGTVYYDPLLSDEQSLAAYWFNIEFDDVGVYNAEVIFYENDDCTGNNTSGQQGFGSAGPPFNQMQTTVRVNLDDDNTFPVRCIRVGLTDVLEAAIATYDIDNGGEAFVTPTVIPIQEPYLEENFWSSIYFYLTIVFLSTMISTIWIWRLLVKL